jgi:hypothetical protein
MSVTLYLVTLVVLKIAVSPNVVGFVASILYAGIAELIHWRMS